MIQHDFVKINKPKILKLVRLNMCGVVAVVVPFLILFVSTLSMNLTITVLDETVYRSLT